MKVTSTCKTPILNVVTDEFNAFYMRVGPTSWLVLNREAWERPSEQVEKNLEAAYQEYVSKRPSQGSTDD